MLVFQKKRKLLVHDRSGSGLISLEGISCEQKQSRSGVDDPSRLQDNLVLSVRNRLINTPIPIRRIFLRDRDIMDVSDMAFEFFRRDIDYEIS